MDLYKQITNTVAKIQTMRHTQYVLVV